MKPTLGRIVHFTSAIETKDGWQVFPAIITAVAPSMASTLGINADGSDYKPGFEESDYVVSLHVFFEHGQSDYTMVPFAGDAEPGSEQARGKWQWPPCA